MGRATTMDCQAYDCLNEIDVGGASKRKTHHISNLPTLQIGWRDYPAHWNLILSLQYNNLAPRLGMMVGALNMLRSSNGSYHPPHPSQDSSAIDYSKLCASSARPRPRLLPQPNCAMLSAVLPMLQEKQTRMSSCSESQPSRRQATY
eukprot:scaffold2005_cov115-Skeletonema_dohrnii-CCMP3373.AAC.1